MNKFLAGLALGITIGVLIAPDKGSETRKKLADKGKQLKDQFDEFVDSWTEKLEALKTDAEDIIETGKAKPLAV